MGGERREGGGAGGGFLRQSERMRFAIYCYDQAKKRRQAPSCVRSLSSARRVAIAK